MTALPWLLTFTLVVACTQPSSDTGGEAAVSLPETEIDSIEAAKDKFEQILKSEGEGGEAAEWIGSTGVLYYAHGYLAAAQECFELAHKLDPRTPKWPYLTAYIEQAQGNQQDAVDHFRAALEIDPNYPPGHYRLGESLLALNRPEEAQRAFQRALTLDPDYEVAHFGIGRAWLALEDYETAVENLREVLAAQPEATRIHHPLGLALRALGDLSAAQEHLALAGAVDVLLVDPLVAEVERTVAQETGHLTAGMEAGLAGDPEQAHERYVQAVAADPEDLAARHNLAVSLTDRGELPAAVEQYREILARDANNPQALLGLGTLLVRSGEVAEGIASLESAIRVAPGFRDAQRTLATAYAGAGRWQEAIAIYEELLSADPADTRVRLAHAVALTNVQRMDQALDELDAIQKAEPANPQVASTSASVLSAAGRPAAALQVLRDFLDANPQGQQRAPILRRLAHLLNRNGRQEDALRLLNEAVELSPGDVEGLLLRARVLTELNRLDEAGAQYESLIERNPRHVAAHLGKVDVLWRHGDCTAAKAHLEDARQSMPNSARLADSLARVLAACPDPTVRSGARALEIAHGLVQARPSIGHLETLAMALAEAGRFDDAAELQRQLIDQVREQRPEWVEDMQDHLRSYRASEPLRLHALNP